MNLSFLTLLSVTIVLTKKALTQLQRVLSVVFAYVDLLHDEAALRRYYEEEALLHHTAFRFQAKNNGSGYVDGVACNLATLPRAAILNFAPFRCFDFAHLQSLVQRLAPATCLALLSCHERVFPEVAFLQDPVYGTRFGDTGLRGRRAARR